MYKRCIEFNLRHCKHKHISRERERLQRVCESKQLINYTVDVISSLSQTTKLLSLCDARMDPIILWYHMAVSSTKTIWISCSPSISASPKKFTSLSSHTLSIDYYYFFFLVKLKKPHRTLAERITIVDNMPPAIYKM